MENRTEKKTVSTVDMTTEVFKAMSQGKEPSWEPLARRSGRTGAVEVEKRQEQE